MITSLDTFKKGWAYESQATEKLFAALTDVSLRQQVVEGHRNLGNIAWHITETIPELMNRTGLTVQGPRPEDKAPTSAAQILEEYRKASASLINELDSKWTDATLKEENDMYGETWTNGMTLMSLIAHQTHHRGQMTILMRQAGLNVPGVYGPSKEEWAAMGMEAPV
ncbi:MAG: DinB family protein [Candidatus Xenobiia bacterium LiM19]